MSKRGGGSFNGEQITSNTGQPIKMRQPLDWMAVTDHTDGMGLILDLMAGTPEIMADPDGKRFHQGLAKGGAAAQAVSVELIGMAAQNRVPEALTYAPGNPCYKAVWDDIVQAAEEYNEPHRFTAFIGYEWTSLVNGNNLHRNIIFRDGAERAGQILPFTMSPPAGSPNPRDLWKWMQAYEDKTGGSVLAIPHNGNLSNGMMFSVQDDLDGGKAFDREYAETRQKRERLFEITQFKGDGEAHPLLSPNDEFADFEQWDWGNLDISAKKTPQMLPGEYACSGLKRGLELEAKIGVNPFKFGFAAGSDTHTAIVSPDNDNFLGKFAYYEPRPDRTIHVAKENKELGIIYSGWNYITFGLTGVWATDNTRGALFDAMQRREVYGTTGTRIRLRFFGGYDFTADDTKRRDLALIGYTTGVPMGSDLPAAPEGKAPSFLVFALRDPMGANLDRVQIVKGWLDASGNAQEKVYDVAWSGDRQPGADGKLPSVGDTVDLTIPSYTNTIGAPELGTAWIDPDFDPVSTAFYYARVIEIPTPRWTAYDKVKFNVDLPDHIPLKTTERAYSSPIWYGPKG